MPKKPNLLGKRFGKLVVIEETDKKSSYGAILWRCECDCGNKKTYRTSELTTMNRKSCGCSKIEKIKGINTTHGMSGTRLYKIWELMKARCFNPASTSYSLYGAKGITVCEEWFQFNKFGEWALSNGYKDNLSIDRIDFKGNYEPSNCRWSTPKEQARNTSRTILITHNSETKCLLDWVRELNLKYPTVQSRIKRGDPQELWFLSKEEYALKRSV